MNTTEHAEKPVIGIDVAKDSLVLFIDSDEERFTCPNAGKDLSLLTKRLKKLDPELIVLEASVVSNLLCK